jgi:hypothetical protein
MLQTLLGFDSDILAKTSLKEQAGYRLAGWLFALVSFTMVLADAWFGHLFYAGWAGILLSGLFLGYIHFAVYRLAMITLTTRPLKEKEIAPVSGTFARVKSWIKPDAASLFRLLFVGLIALAVSFPGASLVYYRQAEQIQTAQRELLRSEMDSGIGQKLYNPEARFPFLVFKTLWQNPGYRLLTLCWVVWIFTPLFILSCLRHGLDMQYCREVALLHREMAERDFYSNLLEAQQEIDARFQGKVILKDLIRYNDPPFNTEFRNRKNRQFGDHRDFAAHLNSL